MHPITESHFPCQLSPAIWSKIDSLNARIANWCGADEKLKSDTAEVRELPDSQWTPGAEHRAAQLRSRLVESLQDGVRLLPDLGELLATEVAAELRSAQQSAFVALEEAKAEVNERLVAIGYRADLADQDRYRLGIDNGMIAKHPLVAEARNRYSSIGGFHLQPMIDANQVELSKLREKLAAVRRTAMGQLV